MKTHKLCLFASVAVLAASAAASGAMAADADQPVATAATSTVAPLTITAERRTVNLQSAPIAASVITGSQLQVQGIQLTRRTVAKYREQLNIPVARLRKEL